MAKIYLFAIGGTGSRVLKALTLLFASGCKLPNGFDTVVPIILDPDLQNGDMNRTCDIIGYYRNIRKSMEVPNDFFSQKIEALKAENGVNEKILFSINTQEQDFSSFIDYNLQTKEDKHFLNLLFSQNNLDSDLSVGFKGNPNMGAVVLNRFIESDDFANFINAFQSNDAIFIVSSIFGGTGAAGFPLVLKTLRSDLHGKPEIKNAKIGAISLQPYFNVEINAESAIDSSTFNEKAKVALEYYKRTIHQTNLLECLYLIGYDSPTPIPNSDGAATQKNKANFIEMAAALSLFDFCKSIDRVDRHIESEIREFGVEDDTLPYSFTSLNRIDYDVVAENMAKFKLMSNYLNSDNKKTSWRKYFEENFFHETDYSNLRKVFENYEEWLQEMSLSHPEFKPFQEVEESKAMNFIVGKSCKSSFLGFGGTTNYQELDTQLNEFIKKSEEKALFPKFVKMFDGATESTLQKKKLI
ncbi:MAG: hypothetical protein RR202_11420 [Bacteroidales bacterium]